MQGPLIPFSMNLHPKGSKIPIFEVSDSKKGINGFLDRHLKYCVLGFSGLSIGQRWQRFLASVETEALLTKALRSRVAF